MLRSQLAFSFLGGDGCSGGGGGVCECVCVWGELTGEGDWSSIVRQAGRERGGGEGGAVVHDEEKSINERGMK